MLGRSRRRMRVATQRLRHKSSPLLMMPPMGSVEDATVGCADYDAAMEYGQLRIATIAVQR